MLRTYGHIKSFTGFYSYLSFFLTETVQVVSCAADNLLRSDIKSLLTRAQLFLFLGQEIKTCFRLAHRHKTEAVQFLKQRPVSSRKRVFVLPVCTRQDSSCRFLTSSFFLIKNRGTRLAGPEGPRLRRSSPAGRHKRQQPTNVRLWVGRFVHPPGLEPRTPRPKRGMISISPQVQYSVTASVLLFLVIFNE